MKRSASLLDFSPDDGAQTALVFVVRVESRPPTLERAEDGGGAGRTRHGRPVVVDEGVAVVTRIRPAHLFVAVEVGDDGTLTENDLTMSRNGVWYFRCFMTLHNCPVVQHANEA